MLAKPKHNQCTVSDKENIGDGQMAHSATVARLRANARRQIWLRAATNNLPRAATAGLLVTGLAPHPRVGKGPLPPTRLACWDSALIDSIQQQTYVTQHPAECM